MIYDLIIVGAGPGGAMAARTAAQNGLKVLLLERNSEPGRISRYCSRMMRIGSVGFQSDKVPTDLEMKRVTLSFELGDESQIIRLHGLPEVVTIEYRGELGPCLNKTWVSPSGTVFCRRATSENLEGYVVDKEELLRGLILEAEQVGCEVRVGTKCTAMEDTPDGVVVYIRHAAGEEKLITRRAVLADGSFSPLLEQLGYNKGRLAGRGRIKFMTYILDRLDSPYGESNHLSLAMPSRHPGFVNVNRWPPGRFHVGTSASVTSRINLPNVLNTFMGDSPFSGMFAGAKIVEKQACNMDLRPPVADAARGNVIAVGDNVAYAETAIKGAMGLGYMAAIASQAALLGQDGNALYNNHWQHGFNFFSPQYKRWNKRIRKMPAVLDDMQINTLYEWISSRNISGMPNDILYDNRDQLYRELPEIAGKLMGETVDPSGRSVA